MQYKLSLHAVGWGPTRGLAMDPTADPVNYEVRGMPLGQTAFIRLIWKGLAFGKWEIFDAEQSNRWGSYETEYEALAALEVEVNSPGSCN